MSLHLLPGLKPGEMRITITVVPSVDVSKAAVQVVPEQVPGGWSQVIELCTWGIRVALQEMNRPQEAVPHILLPGSGETL